MIRWPIIIAVAISLQGCALFGWRSEEPIKIEKKAAAPENAEKVWTELRKRNVDLVLFALTDDGYEELSVDAANIRNFIATQREIIIKYREYYEPQGEKK